MNRTHFNAMVVTLMNLQGTFECIDTFLLGWSSRSFYTHIHPNIVMQIIPGRQGFGGGDVSVSSGSQSLLRAGEVRGQGGGLQTMFCYVFLSVGSGGFNTVGAR